MGEGNCRIKEMQNCEEEGEEMYTGKSGYLGRKAKQWEEVRGRKRHISKQQ